MGDATRATPASSTRAVKKCIVCNCEVTPNRSWVRILNKKHWYSNGGRSEHHCRKCGFTVCDICSTGRLKFRLNTKLKSKRACDRCWLEEYRKKKRFPFVKVKFGKYTWNGILKKYNAESKTWSVTSAGNPEGWSMEQLNPKTTQITPCTANECIELLNILRYE